MGNLQICVGQDEYDIKQFNKGLVLFGHIHNSQTRLLMNIMDKASIFYSYKPLKMPDQYELQKSSGKPVMLIDGIGRTDILKQKAIPFMMHDGKKLVANFINLSLYLNENFDKLSKLSLIPADKALTDRTF